MRLLLSAALVLGCIAAAPMPALVPAPREIALQPQCAGVLLDRPLRFARDIDAAGVELVRERWVALGIPAPLRVDQALADVVAVPDARLAADASTLQVCGAKRGSVRIKGGSADARFAALATLAQLPLQNSRPWKPWSLPPVAIADAPAMPWRIVSDDVSRGPFPTLAYAKFRIRMLAALKINGWSPYMEQVVRDARAPYVAFPDRWLPQELHELAVYARRFHVTLIPEQQTFAHLHEVLKWERFAPLAELPHGYLVAESDPRTYDYLGPLIVREAQAVAPAPFFHLGADEPLDLGRGRTPRTAHVFADHVRRVAGFLAGAARPMIWDDAIQQDHAILGLIPHDTVVVSFHYGVEPAYTQYLAPVAAAGFAQMVAPGAANWTELYPDLATSYANTARFVRDGRATRGVLGMFFTVWHDDGETLFESTWPAVAYAAAAAWQRDPVDDAHWHATFARAFFGSADPQLAADLDALRDVRTLLRTAPADPVDYTFWHDPFDARLQARAETLDLAGIRTRAESVMSDLWDVLPPLHPDAAAAMRLGALRYDVLGRRLQIGREARAYYDDGRAQATQPGNNRVYRSLNVAKYLCWELRDQLASLRPLYERAWAAENTAGGLPRVIAKYTAAEADAQRCADRIDAVEREDYLRSGRVPTFDEALAR